MITNFDEGDDTDNDDNDNNDLTAQSLWMLDDMI